VDLAGVPAISLPIAKDKNNLPIGVQLIAKHFDEQTLFDGAKIVEDSVR
jgi:aspartyl-tRNA(Asn)/glutamyl-tRNA(Gln) amidotransferase subunit A